jgi:hypothetical protein
MDHPMHGAVTNTQRIGEPLEAFALLTGSANLLFPELRRSRPVLGPLQPGLYVFPTHSPFELSQHACRLKVMNRAAWQALIQQAPDHAAPNVLI